MNENVPPLQLSEDVEQAVMWSVYADLLRKHPSALQLWMEYYPTGGQMLTAGIPSQTRWVQLNTGGGSLWVRDGDRYFSHEESIWRIAVSLGVRRTTELLEDTLGLRRREKPEPATSMTLVPRVIAAFLRRHIFTNYRWSVRAVHSHEDVDQGQPAIKALYQSGPVDFERTPIDFLFWRIVDHVGETSAVVAPDGRAVTKGGVVVDLLETYLRSNRKVDPVVDTVFGQH